MRTRSRSICNPFVLLALLVSLAGGTVTYTPAHAAGILFAKPVAAGNGTCSSWANACSLQSAISRSSMGDEIWVRAGTYRPHVSDRTVSFNLKNGLAIYGGFAGMETQRNQRNPAVNVTVLSGDLNGDDIGFANNGEDSFHVVRASTTNSTAILDGFTISGGNADNPAYPDHSGGGIFSNSGSPTLTNVIFAYNRADFRGGGMYNYTSNPALTNVYFHNNVAFYGGGIYSEGGSNPTLMNVTFYGNFAGDHGGGMYNASNVSARLTNVTFSTNSAEFGGGMINRPNVSATLTNVTFSNNVAHSSGGGMFNSGSLTLINTIIANNPSGGDCVGSGMVIASFNNLIENPSNACGLTHGVNGNIIGVDPKLGPLANNGGPTQTHALLPGSPAINAGTNTNCPAADQRGVPRPQGSRCDMGAFESRPLTISGQAGAAGVTLNYNIDNTPQTAITQSNGIYSFTTPEGWSDTVTPAHACFTFSPPNRNYSNITANQPAQNYSALFNPSSGCAAVDVKFGQTIQGTAGIPPSFGVRLSFPANSGPMFVNSTNNIPIVASERVIPRVLNPRYFSEMMGLPDNLKSTRYAFPAYDNIFFDSQLRFGNVGTANTTVTVSVGNLLSVNYLLTPNESRRVSFAGQSGGPILIQSSGGVPIIASLRVVPRPSTGSFSEIMGLPQSQWSSSYIFPWYNNVELNTQLRVGNVGTSATTVTVTVRGVTIGTFSLASNASTRLRFGGVNTGPVKVTSSGNVPIVASLRVAFGNDNTWTSYSEMMGTPESQLDNTYVFPWYNNKDLDTQLRLGNLTNSTASVRVFIGGQEMAGSPFTLAAGASLRKSYPGIDKGPVKIVSTQNIVASQRILFKNGSTPTSFSELMGFPATQLVTSYWFPWYNNVDLNTQLRLGVP